LLTAHHHTCGHSGGNKAESVFLWIHVYGKTDYIGQREMFIAVSVS